VTVPLLVLMLAAMVTAMSVSLRDHAAHSAAVDLAKLRAEHAADVFVASCLTHEGCDPAHTEDVGACAAGDAGVVVTARVSWDPIIWTRLSPTTGEHVVAYDRGVGVHIKDQARAAVGPC
jgi:hypothetical protein